MSEDLFDPIVCRQITDDLLTSSFSPSGGPSRIARYEVSKNKQEEFKQLDEVKEALSTVK